MGPIVPSITRFAALDRSNVRDNGDMNTNANTQSHTVTETLQQLHDHYVQAVNLAVADDDMEQVERLAAEFDIEALDVVRHSLAA
jgi:hypothetical protein